MVANANDLTAFVTRPVSAVSLALSALMVGWPPAKSWRQRRRGESGEPRAVSKGPER